MSPVLLTTVAWVVAAVLCVAVIRRFLLCYAAARLYRTRPATAASPRIWIACACRDEATRIPGLAASLAELPYRGERRVILIDDSSSDGSAELMRAAEARWPCLFTAVALTGPQRGKAEALREGLAQVPMADDDLLLVVDADHRLAPDALGNVVNYFADPAVTAVAIEHPVARPDRSLVSAYCFLEAAVSEAVTGRGQDALGLSTKLAGSWACRPAAFRRLFPGGWQLVDDTVFTAAILAEGGRVAHAADVRALQEVPDQLRGYVLQHVRWSSGYAASARRSVAQRARREGALQRIDSVATHAGYAERPLLLLLFVLAALGAWAGTWLPALLAALVVGLYVAAIGLQIGCALRLSGADRRLVLMSLASLPMLAVDMAVSIWGIAAGLTGRRIGWTTEHRA